MNQNPLEKNHERILTKEEVMEIMSRFVENFTLVRELSDKQGLYSLEIKIEGKEQGETIEYWYVRKGRFPNHIEESKTSICVTYYKNGTPVSGKTVAVYEPETGEWIDTR